MQKVLKNIVWGCLFIVPFIALYIADGGTFDILHWGTSGLYFPFITGKNFLFRAVIEIAFASWIILAINDVKYRVKKSPLLVAYGVFMLILLAADLFGVDVHESIWSNYERMEGFIGHIHLFVYFVLLTSMLSTIHDWSKMFKVFVASNVLVMGYGFMQFLGAKDYFFYKLAPTLSAKIGQNFPVHMSDSRLDATIGNSAYYAMYCLFFAFVCAVLFSQAKSKGEKWVYGVIGILNLISIFYSGTRGTLIGLLLGVLSTLAIIAWHERGHMRKVLFGTLLVIVVVVGGIFAFKDSSLIKNSPTLSRFSSISIKDVTTMSRFTIWKMSYEGWKQRPLLGYGQDNFTYIFPRQFDPAKMWNSEAWFDRSHNVFFDWLVAGGILGLLSYLSIFAVAAYLLWRKDTEISLRERAIVTGAFIGYFIHNIFVFDNLTSYILFILLIAYISVRSHKGAVHLGNFHFGEMKDIAQPVVALLFVIMFYYINYLPHLTNMLMIRAMDTNRLLQQNTPFEEILKIQKDSFNSAVDIGLLGKQEAEEQFFQTTQKMISYKIPDTLPAAQKQAIVQAENDLISSARAHAEKILPEYKDNVRMLDLIGIFYNAIGDGVNAEKVILQATAIAPKKQLILFDLVRVYVREGKFNEAYDVAGKAYSFAPIYPDAMKIYILTSIYAHKFNDAKKVLATNNQIIPLDNDIISTLVQVGQTGDAITMLNDYKKANPQYTSQIDAFIKQLVATPKK